MAVTEADVRTHIGAVAGVDDAVITRCLAEAKVLVDDWVGDNVVPQVIRERAYIEVAADLFNRRNAPNGIYNMQYTTADGASGAPIRIARDPMAAGYPLLRKYVKPW